MLHLINHKLHLSRYYKSHLFKMTRCKNNIKWHHRIWTYIEKLKNTLKNTITIFSLHWYFQTFRMVKPYCWIHLHYQNKTLIRFHQKIWKKSTLFIIYINFLFLWSKIISPNSNDYKTIAMKKNDNPQSHFVLNYVDRRFYLRFGVEYNLCVFIYGGGWDKCSVEIDFMEVI